MPQFGTRERGAQEEFDLKTYNELQVREIQRHKWIESEKAGRDLGQEAVLSWIQRHAEAFREAHGYPPAERARKSWPERLKNRFAAFVEGLRPRREA